MKMRYLFSNKTNTSRRIYIFFVFLLVIVLLGKFVSSIFFPAFSSVFFPAVSLGTNIDSKTSSWLRLLEPKSSLIKENEDLKTKIVELSSDNARLMRKISDYEAISSLIKKKDGKEGGVIGKVISLPDKSPFDTVLVLLISDGDVSVGDIAYGQNGVLVGKVERVSKDNVTVRMFSSPGERHNVFIGGSKIFGEAVGRGGGMFEVKLPRGIDVMSGDQVIMPDVSSGSFGVVESVELKESDTFQTILFKNPFSFSELRFLEIYKN